MRRGAVSMLGDDVPWLKNVGADGGRAVLHLRRTEPVRLVDLPVGQRAPVLRRYPVLRVEPVPVG